MVKSEEEKSPRHHVTLPHHVTPGREEIQDIFRDCRAKKWSRVLEALERNPAVGTTLMTMNNNISTTVLHQAITGKKNTKIREQVICKILEVTPSAAQIENGYGSLPLHVISQRNVSLDAKTKEKLIRELIAAYPGALVATGGPGGRTPVHVIFTDYISPGLTQFIIDTGREACFIKDAKEWLPAHVACSRHCSPEKLRMLLAVNPDALFEETKEGKTLLDLAESTATKTHPNYALLQELKEQLKNATPRHREVNDQALDAADDAAPLEHDDPYTPIEADIHHQYPAPYHPHHPYEYNQHHSNNYYHHYHHHHMMGPSQQQMMATTAPNSEERFDSPPPPHHYHHHHRQQHQMMPMSHSLQEIGISEGHHHHMNSRHHQHHASYATTPECSEASTASRDRLDSNDSERSWASFGTPPPKVAPHKRGRSVTTKRKRKSKGSDGSGFEHYNTHHHEGAPNPSGEGGSDRRLAGLLLHFASGNTTAGSSEANEESPACTQIEEV